MSGAEIALVLILGLFLVLAILWTGIILITAAEILRRDRD